MLDRGSAVAHSSIHDSRFTISPSCAVITGDEI
jgi:hypothetical protein